MTAPDVDALEAARAAAADLYGRIQNVGPTGPDAIDLIADALLAAVRERDALRAATEGLIEKLSHEAADQKSGEYAWGMRHAIADLRALLAAVDGGQ